MQRARALLTVVAAVIPVSGVTARWWARLDSGSPEPPVLKYPSVGIAWSRTSQLY